MKSRELIAWVIRTNERWPQLKFSQRIRSCMCWSWWQWCWKKPKIHPRRNLPLPHRTHTRLFVDCFVFVQELTTLGEPKALPITWYEGSRWKVKEENEIKRSQFDDVFKIKMKLNRVKPHTHVKENAVHDTIEHVGCKSAIIRLYEHCTHQRRLPVDAQSPRE